MKIDLHLCEHGRSFKKSKIVYRKIDCRLNTLARLRIALALRNFKQMSLRTMYWNCLSSEVSLTMDSLVDQASTRLVPGIKILTPFRILLSMMVSTICGQRSSTSTLKTSRCVQACVVSSIGSTNLTSIKIDGGPHNSKSTRLSSSAWARMNMWRDPANFDASKP